MLSFDQHNCYLRGSNLCSLLLQVLYIFLVLLEKARQPKSPLNCTVLSQLISQRALVAAHIWRDLHTASMPASPPLLTSKCNFESWKVFFPRNLSFIFKPENLLSKQLRSLILDPSRRAGDAARHRSGVTAWALWNEPAVTEAPRLTEMSFLLLCALSHSCSLNVYSHYHCLLKKFQLRDHSLKEICLPFGLQQAHSDAQMYCTKLPPKLGHCGWALATPICPTSGLRRGTLI